MRPVHGEDWGILTGNICVDLAQLRTKKDSIVAQLTTGLVGLAKRRKVQTLRGTAVFTADTSLDMDGEPWTFDQAVIAVGAAPVHLPDWPEDDRIWDPTDALGVRDVPETFSIVGGRDRLHHH